MYNIEWVGLSGVHWIPVHSVALFTGVLAVAPGSTIPFCLQSFSDFSLLWILSFTVDYFMVMNMFEIVFLLRALTTTSITWDVNTWREHAGVQHLFRLFLWNCKFETYQWAKKGTSHFLLFGWLFSNSANFI